MAFQEFNTPEGVIRTDVTNGILTRTIDGEVVEERPVTDDELCNFAPAMADLVAGQQEVLNQLILDALGF